MANHTPAPGDCDSMLFKALQIAQVPADTSNMADREVREMAGSNVFVRIDNVFARIDALDKRMDDVIRSVQWGFGLTLSFFTILFGYFFTIIQSMLQRMIQ